MCDWLKCLILNTSAMLHVGRLAPYLPDGAFCITELVEIDDRWVHFICSSFLVACGPNKAALTLLECLIF